jgi:hypothetical protein
MAINATAAKPYRAPWSRVFFPMRSTASTTTAATTGRNVNVGHGQIAEKKHDEDGGITKRAPAAIPPRMPFMRQPM